MKTVALLHPGEMGAASGACLGGRGLRVVWASAGRSAATRSRAKAAGLEDLGPIERALDVADIVLSVCPPHGALALAREVAGHGFTGVYIDTNPVSPGTSRRWHYHGPPSGWRRELAHLSVGRTRQGHGGSVRGQQPRSDSARRSGG